MLLYYLFHLKILPYGGGLVGTYAWEKYISPVCDFRTEQESRIVQTMRLMLY